MKKLIYLSMCALALSGCSYTDVVITGPLTDPVQVDDVVVYYDQVPRCDYTVIAYITVPGDFLSRERLIKAFRNKAAAFGASGVQITQVQKTGASSFHGSARAIRCSAS
jgi:hypothetical protein